MLKKKHPFSLSGSAIHENWLFNITPLIRSCSQHRAGDFPTEEVRSSESVTSLQNSLRIGMGRNKTSDQVEPVLFRGHQKTVKHPRQSLGAEDADNTLHARSLHRHLKLSRLGKRKARLKDAPSASPRSYFARPRSPAFLFFKKNFHTHPSHSHGTRKFVCERVFSFCVVVGVSFRFFFLISITWQRAREIQ